MAVVLDVGSGVMDRARKRLEDMSSRILSNLVMVGQIPSPSGGEHERAKHIRERFTQAGLQEIGQDSVGNVFGMLPGTEGRRTIGLFAAIDTIFSAEVDPSLDVTLSRVSGPGVSYNSLAASALVSLAEFFVGSDLITKDNLLFVGLARNSEYADQEGMRTFLASPLGALDSALMLESIQLGRLSYFTVGCLRFDLAVQLSDVQVSGNPATHSAISILADAINLLLAIELPNRPKTVLNLGMIEGGESHEDWATKALVGGQILCESPEILQRFEDELEDIAGHISSHYSCTTNIHKFGRRTTGGLRFSHPMVRTLRALMNELGIEAQPGPDSTSGSLAMAAGIPTLTLALTTGRRSGRNSYVDIEPISRGLLQVIVALHRLGEVAS